MKLITKYQREIQILSDFKEKWKEYNSLDLKRNKSFEDNERMLSLRGDLNSSSVEVELYVGKSGVSAGAYYSPPPAVGGVAGHINFFANLYRLDQFSISPQIVIDCLEKTIGTYKFWQKRYLRKLLNPVYWIGEIIRIPFYFASYAGFNSKKLEFSFLGKGYKFLAALITLAWTIIEMLNFFGINLAKLTR